LIERFEAGLFARPFFWRASACLTEQDRDVFPGVAGGKDAAVAVRPCEEDGPRSGFATKTSTTAVSPITPIDFGCSL
jgi:hypothetical protein